MIKYKGLKIIGLKKAVGMMPGENSKGIYVQVAYDRQSGQIHTGLHQSSGHGSWIKYDDENIINIGFFETITMAELKECIYKNMEEVLDIEESEKITEIVDLELEEENRKDKDNTKDNEIKKEVAYIRYNDFGSLATFSFVKGTDPDLCDKIELELPKGAKHIDGDFNGDDIELSNGVACALETDLSGDKPRPFIIDSTPYKVRKIYLKYRKL